MRTFDAIRQKAYSIWNEQVENSSLPLIAIGTASCGRAAGAMQVLETVRATLAELKMEARVIQVGCIGPCYLEPLLDMTLPGGPRVCYGNMTPEKAVKILTACLVKGEHLPKMATGHFGNADFTEKTGIPRFFDLPMLKPQVRVILRNCGWIDPEDIDHYLARDGYVGLQKVLSQDPLQAIEWLKESGLRGRGGAGFPAYKKWELCRAAQAERKYVVCNADEGDPGAFMNRALLESDPHAVLEGMVTGGYAIGAGRGIIYVRAEYPLAVIRLEKAIQQMREYGLLGKDILGSGFDFDISIKEGAGAFVCGEETALIASIEGRRGMPRPRPPFPAVRGLHGCPTLINNTETFGTVPAIMRNGGAWFHQFGVPGNYGTKTFSLVGKVRHTGLIEVPLGMTLRQIVNEIGGGTKKPIKAVQTGGPLGGCLSAAQLDTPVTYETMRDQGSMMGSGGLIVMDESTCIVDMARYFTGFAQSESCGNCTPCRIGTRVLMSTLEKIARGEGEATDLEVMRKAAHTMVQTSLCGLGQAASNPVTSSLRFFLSEYEDHIHRKTCPAAVCPDLFEYAISFERCSGCGLCVEVCREGAIHGKRREPYFLDARKCIQCRACVAVCAREAIQGVPVANSLSQPIHEGVVL
jgi:NADH-quinone oxidoreductase subunit F